MRSKLLSSLSTAALIMAVTMPAPVEAIEVSPKNTIITTSQAAACADLLNLASVNRSWIIRPYSNPSNYSVLVGLDWELGNASNSEKLALLRTHACRVTGSYTNSLFMLVLGQYYVQPIGEYNSDNLILYPTSGFGAISTLVTATASQSCLDMLNLANRAHRNDLIVRSYIGQLNYTAVGGQTWRGLTNGEKLATLLALQCHASGSPAGRQDMLVQDNATGEVIGRLVNGQLELY